MFELFVAGTFWFWALVAAEIVCLFLFVEWENGLGATISVLCFAGLLQWFGDTDIIGYCFSNPLHLVAIAGAYFALGAVWGVVKWYIFCKDRLEEYEELKVEFLRNKGVAEGTKVVPEQHRPAWKEMLERHRGPYNRGQRLLSEAPLVRYNKATVLRWMTFWPVSMLWGLINDFVKRVCKSIYQRMAKFLQRISDNIFSRANVSDDLAGIEEEQ